MRHGIVLFSCDRGITPAQAAKPAEERGFGASYVPEHTHIPNGEFVNSGPCRAFPKPAQAHMPLITGAGGGPKTFAWIARHADGWMTTPGEQDISGKAAALRQAWAGRNRPGDPDIRVPVTAKPSPADLAAWAAAGATELLWGLPDAPAEAYLDRLAGRIAI